MALGLLEGYSSHSDISNSDDEDPRTTPSVHVDNRRDKQQETPCDDEQESERGDEEETHKLRLFTAEGGDEVDDEESSGASSPEETKDTPIPNSNLPLPDLDTKHHLSESAFRNPYKEAEEAKLAILKHHVGDFAKETDQDKGRRPWRHRNKKHADNAGGGEAQSGSHWSPERHGGAKKRSGVVDCLVPPQKALKLHQQIQAKERPWTMRP